MATSPLQAGSAPANSTLAPDTFQRLAGDGYIIQGGVEALFKAINDALDGPPPQDPAHNHAWNQALSLAGVGAAETARLGKVLEEIERAGSRFVREPR